MFTKKIIIVLSALVALSSCSSPENVRGVEAVYQNSSTGAVMTKNAVDGYKFNDKYTYSADFASIKVFRHTTASGLLTSYYATGKVKTVGSGWLLKGFTQYTYKGGKAYCDIHIMDPRRNYEPEFIGHEFVHCIHGDFHHGDR